MGDRVIEFTHWAELHGDDGSLVTAHQLRVRAEWEEGERETGRYAGWWVTEATLMKRGEPQLILDTQELASAYGVAEVDRMESKARSLALEDEEIEWGIRREPC